MAAQSQPITLTIYSNSVSFTLASKNIMYVKTSTNGSTVTYYRYGAAPTILEVTQTAANIATACDTIIPITVGGATEYINPDYIVQFGDNTVSGTDIVYNYFGATNAIITCTESQSTLQALINAIIDAENVQVGVIAGSAYASPTVLTAVQSGSICLLDAAAGNVYTLPAATAANTGVRFKLIQKATVTSNAATIQGATSADLFVAGGSIMQTKGTATPTVAYYSPNGSSNYKVSCNGTTTGGIIGDVYEVVCLGLNQWQVNGTQSASGTVASPFAG